MKKRERLLRLADDIRWLPSYSAEDLDSTLISPRGRKAPKTRRVLLISEKNRLALVRALELLAGGGE